MPAPRARGGVCSTYSFAWVTCWTCGSRMINSMPWSAYSESSSYRTCRWRCAYSGSASAPAGDHDMGTAFLRAGDVGILGLHPEGKAGPLQGLQSLGSNLRSAVLERIIRRSGDR